MIQLKQFSYLHKILQSVSSFYAFDKVQIYKSQNILHNRVQTKTRYPVRTAQ
jgi:hypothetical protein